MKAICIVLRTWIHRSGRLVLDANKNDKDADITQAS